MLGAFEHIARLDRIACAAAAVQSPEELVRVAPPANVEVTEMINFALGAELSNLNRRLGLD